MTDHGIVAADWQWKAAQQGLLSTMIVPLDPEPRKKGNTWVWPCEPIDLFWFDSEGVGERLLKKLPWQIGDRIFFQEEWCKGDWGVAFDDDIYFTKSTTPEAENIGWQPAHTMPVEAAEYWFEVTGVEVMQMKDMDFSDKDWAGAVFTTNSQDVNDSQLLWDRDRWVIVLGGKTLEDNNA
jgi:hypothetical protein